MPAFYRVRHGIGSDQRPAAQQYVVNLSRGNTPPPINDTIPGGGIDIGVAIANSPH